MRTWHKEGEQRMVETSKQKTQIQAHHKDHRKRAGMLGERGLGLVDHVPLGCVAKINTP